MSPFETWAIAAIALFLKTFLTASVQGAVRIKNSAFAKPEDAAFFGRGAPPLEAELPIVARAQNALRNDAENIPIFLALALGYVELGCWGEGTSLYFGAFVFARYLHTLFMIWPAQPWRNWSYLLGVAVLFALSGHIVFQIVGSP